MYRHTYELEEEGTLSKEILSRQTYAYFSPKEAQKDYTEICYLHYNRQEIDDKR